MIAATVPACAKCDGGHLTAECERVFLTYDQAVAFLKPTGDVHTFRNGSGMLVGADWSAASIRKALGEAKRIEITGETAQSMKHGLVIYDDYGPLFIATTRRTDTGTQSSGQRSPAGGEDAEA